MLLGLPPPPEPVVNSYLVHTAYKPTAKNRKEGREEHREGVERERERRKEGKKEKRKKWVSLKPLLINLRSSKPSCDCSQNCRGCREKATQSRFHLKHILYKALEGECCWFSSMSPISEQTFLKPPEDVT